MLSVGCPAAARLRLVVWCKTCDHRTEPDPAEIHAVWISLRPTPDRARQLRSWVVKFGVADRTAIAAAVPPERSMAPGRNGYSDHRQADASLACRRREGEVLCPRCLGRLSCRGTKGSNPSPSSGESTNFRFRDQNQHIVGIGPSRSNWPSRVIGDDHADTLLFPRS